LLRPRNSPLGRAVFEVALDVQCTIDFGDGEVSYDFANNTYEYNVRCPSLIVTLLTPATSHL
jgi:hypothetical protein